MKRELALDWVVNLRGKYADKKGKSYLCRVDEDGVESYCCLGVILDMHDELIDSPKPKCKMSKEGSRASNEVALDDRYLELYGITDDEQCELMGINDNSDTFEAVIEKITEWYITDKEDN